MSGQRDRHDWQRHLSRLQRCHFVLRGHGCRRLAAFANACAELTNACSALTNACPTLADACVAFVNAEVRYSPGLAFLASAFSTNSL